MKILTISDHVERRLYSQQCKEDFNDIDLILSCGDLPFYYLEFLVSILNVPLFYVFGNHYTEPMFTEHGQVIKSPSGCVNLDASIVEFEGLLIGGFEGCKQYNYGPKQYSEIEMRMKVLRMEPLLWKNKLLKKRYIDIIITHAAPYGIHDRPDPCHQGFKSFRTLIERYQPRYFIHGHVHQYSLQDTWKTQYRGTTVINTVGYQVMDIA